MRAAPRDAATRKQDALALLAAPGADVWVSTASADGAPWLVPLSLGWIDERLVVAVEPGSVTARNLLASGTARCAVGPTRDVVMVDAVLERSVAVPEDPDLATAYADQADWDPREAEGYVFLVLRPSRLQAWREADEIVGRTLLRDGTWLV